MYCIYFFKVINPSPMAMHSPTLHRERSCKGPDTAHSTNPTAALCLVIGILSANSGPKSLLATGFQIAPGYTTPCVLCTQCVDSTSVRSSTGQPHTHSPQLTKQNQSDKIFSGVSSQPFLPFLQASLYVGCCLRSRADAFGPGAPCSEAVAVCAVRRYPPYPCNATHSDGSRIYA